MLTIPLKLVHCFNIVNLIRKVKFTNCYWFKVILNNTRWEIVLFYTCQIRCIILTYKC